jgi:hypothetical protein
MPTPFGDYYRCPGHFEHFGISGELSPHPEYFRFHDAICYGRHSASACLTTLNGMLVDLRNSVNVSRGHVELPFDFSEVVENLRLERYQRNSETILTRLTSANASRDLYYFLRPILPVAVRKHLQRLRLTGWEQIPFPEWPVDVTVETLMKAGMELALKSSGVRRIPFIWFWPSGYTSASIITHDVEGPAGQGFCDRLMDIDEASGFRSAFQIVPEERYNDADALFAAVGRRGFETNVHDLNHDGYLFHNREQFSKRAVRINQHVRKFKSRGFRAGAMLREQEWFDELAVSFDMSVPNVAHLESQRGGCCTVMPYFIGNIVELPLTTVQDYSLFHILNDYSTVLWRQQIATLVSNHGLITILTHPDYLIEKRARAVYVELLGYMRQLCEEGKVWMTVPSEVDRWWRLRHAMTLVKEGDQWRIVGAGCDKATLAFAELDARGRLVYKLDCDPATAKS